MSVFAVIGAGYGDEGKGLTTDYLAHQYQNSCVIRFNGGAQAGHTVVHLGKRHVFGHIGSGFFAGAATCLGRHFIVNPILLEQEATELNCRRVYIDPRAIVSTVWDMAVNQALTQYTKKNNTCGVGIHETLQRNLIYGITIGDITKGPKFRNRQIFAAARNASKERLAIYGITLSDLPGHYSDIFESDIILDSFTNTFDKVDRIISVEEDYNMIKYFDHIIFEGAQGLLLDQYHKNFPYVTPSNTGIKNVVEICQEMNTLFVETYYVTRCYKTRHGDGPFPEEAELPFNVIDNTNKPNNYQGSLRFGTLNVHQLLQDIDVDWQQAPVNFGRKKLMVTCMDQVDNTLIFSHGSKPRHLIRTLACCSEFSDVLYSYSSTRNKVVNEATALTIERDKNK